MVLDNTLLKGLGKKKNAIKTPFKINKVNIINGELVFDMPKFHVDLLNFDLMSFPRENQTIYRLTTPHLKAIFPQSGKQVAVEGQMLCEFREQKNSWRLGKFIWETQYMNISANGRFFKDKRMAINIHTQGSFRQLFDPILGKKMSIHEFMYSNSRIKKSRAGTVTLEGDFNTNAFTFGGERFRNLKGTVNWDNRTKRLRIGTKFKAGIYDTSVDISKIRYNIDLTARNVPAATATRIAKIKNIAPLGGMVKEGRIKINRRQFDGTVDLVNHPELLEPEEFQAEGSVDFTYNSKSKNATFEAVNLKTEFGSLERIKGKVTPDKRTKLLLNFNANVNKAEFLDKYTTFYINLPLAQWNLEGGNSRINLDLKRINNDFFIASDVHLRNFDSSKQRIDSMKGNISTVRSLTTGKFKITDKELTGDADFDFNKNKSDLEIRFHNVKGNAQKLLKLLEIDVALTGDMTGEFVYTSNNDLPVPRVTGKFQSPEINFYEFLFDDFKGNMEYTDKLSLTDLSYQYMSGKGDGNIVIDYGKERFDIKGKIESFDLNRLNSEFKGKASVYFDGRGGFEKDPINMKFNTTEIHFYQDQSFTASGEGTILTDFARFRLNAGGTFFDGKVASPATFRLEQEEGVYNGGFTATVKDINLLIPWGDNKGEITVNGEIRGTRDTELTVEGHADFKGQVLSFPNFPHALEDFSGDFTFKDLDFTLRTIQGSMGGGAVQGNGFLTLEDNALKTLFLGLNGQNMTLYPMDRTRADMDAELTLRYIKDRKKLLLAGTMTVHSGMWEREVDEAFTFNTNPELSASGSTIMDMLEYDLRMVSNGNVRFNNSFGNGDGTFDLNFKGSVAFPIVLGTIESTDGTINFSGKKFDLVKARFSFNDKFQNDPQIKIESETFIKNYRIRFNINGPSSRMKPELTSSPQLPTRDILSLISVGELFQRPTSTELSTQIGAGTTGLIASELTEQIKKRTKKIFGNYMLTLDPNISSITGSSILNSSRIIVGKEVSKDFLIVYSTNISTRNPQMVYYLQYRVSPSLSLIGMRNDKEDTFSIELRFRKRH